PLPRPSSMQANSLDSNISGTSVSFISALRKILSTNGITTTERLQQMGINPYIVLTAIYLIWHVGITIMSFISSGGHTEWFGHTCHFVADHIDDKAVCSDPWKEWWSDLRLVAEVIWCIPFMMMIYFNSRMRKSAIKICHDFKLSDDEMEKSLSSIPSIRVRKWVFRVYILFFFTYGTITHFDVASFGILGVVLLWPVYIAQGILIADTASILPILKIVVQHRDKFILIPFEPSGTAGVEPFAENVAALARIPTIFAFVMIARSYILLMLGGGESADFREFLELGVALSMIGISFCIAAGPLFAISKSVLERKEAIIDELASRNGLKDVEVDNILEVDLNQQRVADMILIERIQDIQPVDSNTILRVVRGVAIPAVMIILRPLFGM
ncbi:MAG TPA: hypothetical protein QF555_04175, partial [Candidatus Thalassarchaeaceae archaeon]|nr:hypothetical protein [Candidatus Thalassarchaeaceae archaeon]